MLQGHTPLAASQVHKTTRKRLRHLRVAHTQILERRLGSTDKLSTLIDF